MVDSKTECYPNEIIWSVRNTLYWMLDKDHRQPFVSLLFLIHSPENASRCNSFLTTQHHLQHKNYYTIRLHPPDMNWSLPLCRHNLVAAKFPCGKEAKQRYQESEQLVKTDNHTDTKDNLQCMTVEFRYFSIECAAVTECENQIVLHLSNVFVRR